MSNRQRTKVLAAVYGCIRKAKRGSVQMRKATNYGYGNEHRFGFSVETTSNDEQANVRFEASIDLMKSKGWEATKEDYGFTRMTHPDFKGNVVLSPPSHGSFSAKAHA